MHARCREFRLIVVGDGPQEYRLRAMAADCPWLRVVGPKFDGELAAYLSVSDFMLMPGLVGLVIVDCFAAEVPLITTDHNGHSPEIEYLRHGENGLMTVPCPLALASEMVALIESPRRRARLRIGCRRSAREYTLEGMVERFSVSVLDALAQ